MRWSCPPRGRVNIGSSSVPAFDQRSQAGIGAEEVLAGVVPPGSTEYFWYSPSRVALIRSTRAPSTSSASRSSHCRAPNDLDHVPARAAEDGLELLDDLAVAPHGAVEALQVAVHDERQVVEASRGRRGSGRPIVSGSSHSPSPMKHHTWDPRRVGDAAVAQVAVEAGLVDGVDGAEPHGHGRELPELRHQPGVRVARQAPATDLAAETVELVLGQPAFEVGPGVDRQGRRGPGRRSGRRRPRPCHGRSG